MNTDEEASSENEEGDGEDKDQFHNEDDDDVLSLPDIYMKEEARSDDEDDIQIIN